LKYCVVFTLLFAAILFFLPKSSAQTPEQRQYDIVIVNGHIIDGAGNPWYAADVAISGDQIAAIGDLHDARAKRVIDATGRIVAPGFINLLGQSGISLLLDNRFLSELSQGITSEITGEGTSVAPQNEKTLAALKPLLDQYHLTIDWTTLDGYFRRLEKQGTPLNLGTYVGAEQVRRAVIGFEDRDPTAEELQQMKSLVAQAMQDGALGVSTSLIYPPGSYAKTEELIELAKVASRYGGIYGSHMRSEGPGEMEALAEAIRIGREANLPVEIFHMKVAGKSRWGNMTKVVQTVQQARDSGLDIAANMYPYVASETYLSAYVPEWVSDGGRPKLLERLKDPAVRARIKKEIAVDDWDNIYFEAGGAEHVVLLPNSPNLKQFDDKTLAEVAAAWNQSPEDTIMDFIVADDARTYTVDFFGSEEDLKTGLVQPWTSMGLDEKEMALDGPLHSPHTHPRAFGSMPRFLGDYVCDQHLMTLENAIRKITSLPAQRENLQGRGLLKSGFFADVTIFDAAAIADHATYIKPDQLSTGVDYVIVNGQLEYDQRKLTGATAGRALRGRGYPRSVD